MSSKTGTLFRKKLTVIMYVMLGLAVGSILFLNHRIMLKSQEYQDAFIEANLTNKALLLDYVLKNLSSSLEQLANSTEVTVYFQNVDLQMSLEYGLGLSIAAVQKKLLNFQGLKVLNGNKIFDCISLIDANNHVVAHTNVEEGFDHISILKELLPRSNEKLQNIIAFDYKGELKIALFQPVVLKGIFKGAVFGLLKNQALMQVIEKGGSGSHLFLVYNSLYYPKAEGELKGVSARESRKAPFLIFETQLNYFPFKLVEWVDVRAMRGGLPPWAITLFMGFLSFGLVIAGLYLQRVYEKKEMVQRINEELKEEVEARKRAEELLREAQEELEQKVQERTQELMEKNLKLQNEIRIREEMERQLRQRENMYRELYAEYDAILKNAPEIISVYDACGKILWSNFHDESYEDIFQPLVQEYLKTGIQAKREVTTRDGKIFDVSLSAIRDENGNIVKVLETRRDITEKKKMEAALSELQKFESLATLASGIAHDFNNILGGIMGFAELGLRVKDDSKRMKDYLEKILVGVERGTELVSQILTFSRTKEKGKKPLLLAPIVKETFKMLRATIPKYIAMELSIPKEPIKILGNPTEIQQVLMNLCVNARDAVPSEGGEIRAVLEKDKDSGKAILKVADNGCGIPPEVKDRIFEPYFTTKPKGKGTGLGLSIVYGIVKSLGGEIEVSSEVGKGSCFTVLIPCVEEFGEKVSEEEGLPLKKGQGNIMVVDDEAFMVEILLGMLKELGYQAKGLQDPQEVLKEFKREPFKYDALITDFAMPGMSGLSLAREIKALNQRLPIIMVTGYAQIGHEETAGFGIFKVIKKPVDMHELSYVLSEAISLKGNNSCA